MPGIASGIALENIELTRVGLPEYVRAKQGNVGKCRVYLLSQLERVFICMPTPVTFHDQA